MENIQLTSGDFTLTASSVYNSTYAVAKAIDGSTSTHWMTAYLPSSAWLKADFGRAIQITKVRSYYGYTNGRPNAYILQGSNDNSTWDDVSAGNFSNQSTWQEFMVADGGSYRYWRMLYTSRYGGYYSCSEIIFYHTETIPIVDGWEVVGQEPDMSPDGVVSAHTYQLMRVTKTDNDYAIVLWLKIKDRMKHPQGEVVVNFTGSLQGPGGAFVAPFTLSFVPQNITPIFNPHDPAYISAVDASIVSAIRLLITHSSAEDESDDMHYLTLTDASIANAIRTHIDDIET